MKFNIMNYHTSLLKIPHVKDVRYKLNKTNKLSKTLFFKRFQKSLLLRLVVDTQYAI